MRIFVQGFKASLFFGFVLRFVLFSEHFCNIVVMEASPFFKEYENGLTIYRRQVCLYYLVYYFDVPMLMQGIKNITRQTTQFFPYNLFSIVQGFNTGINSAK